MYQLYETNLDTTENKIAQLIGAYRDFLCVGLYCIENDILKITKNLLVLLLSFIRIRMTRKFSLFLDILVWSGRIGQRHEL